MAFGWAGAAGAVQDELTRMLAQRQMQQQQLVENLRADENQRIQQAYLQLQQEEAAQRSAELERLAQERERQERTAQQVGLVEDIRAATQTIPLANQVGPFDAQPVRMGNAVYGLIDDPTVRGTVRRRMTEDYDQRDEALRTEREERERVAKAEQENLKLRRLYQEYITDPSLERLGAIVGAGGSPAGLTSLLPTPTGPTQPDIDGLMNAAWEYADRLHPQLGGFLDEGTAQLRNAAARDFAMRMGAQWNVPPDQAQRIFGGTVSGPGIGGVGNNPPPADPNSFQGEVRTEEELRQIAEARNVPYEDIASSFEAEGGVIQRTRRTPRGAASRPSAPSGTQRTRGGGARLLDDVFVPRRTYGERLPR